MDRGHSGAESGIRSPVRQASPCEVQERRGRRKRNRHAEPEVERVLPAAYRCTKSSRVVAAPDRRGAAEGEPQTKRKQDERPEYGKHGCLATRSSGRGTRPWFWQANAHGRFGDEAGRCIVSPSLEHGRLQRP